MRVWIRAALAGIAIVLAPSLHAGEPPAFAFVAKPGAIEISIRGEPFATYVFRDPEIPRPYFAHVRAPGGIQVTRHHPPSEGDPQDHATLHPGIWLAFGDLSGHDSWRLKARVESEGIVEGPSLAADRASFTVRNRYLATGGKDAVCIETCRYAIAIRPQGILLVADSRFVSDRAEFFFGDQEEMGLGIRVATSIAVKTGKGGRILDASGRVNEKEVWGKSAEWIDYSGPIGDRSAGMMVVPDPANFRPSWFHARDYGFIAANPFGRKALARGEESKLVIEKGETFRLRFAILIHASPSAAEFDAKAAFEEAKEVLSSTRCTPAIIPQPLALKLKDGEFRISGKTQVIAAGGATAEAVKLIDALAPAMGFRLPLLDGSSPGTGAICLSLAPSLKSDLGDEGHALNVATERIELRAAAPAGLFYGVQTLRQLLPPDIYRAAPVPGIEWTVPCVEITDHPRFCWRGLLIDPARHFIPKRDVMKFIDAMALHKFNRLQIHFTDGQGWRIEIRKYPLLAEVGSRMHNTMDQRLDGARIYGGFYTQADIRELVSYAAERHITIVPEIEMPHHAGAAIVAYPKIGFAPEELAALPPAERWAKAGNTVVPRPETVAFFQDVLDEIVELFPSPYIHIGGDEADASIWAGLPDMKRLMSQKGLADVHELHSWFIKQMDTHLAKRGRRLVGWDEILQGGLAEGATVMSWRGIQGGILAAQAGHDVVMAPTSHTYFDYRQGPGEPEAFGGSEITLKTVYAFEPIPEALTPEQAKHILGGQAQLWGELIPNERHREYMTYPRACALIETIWSPKAHRNCEGFIERLKTHLRRLDAADVHYRRLEGS